MSVLRTPLVLAFLGVLVAPSAAQSPPEYEARILQGPGGAPASPLRINCDGVCVGDFFNTSLFFYDGVVWDAAGAPSTLSDDYGFLESGAYAIRDDGTIVGSGSMDPTEVSHAIIIDPGGGVTTLPSLAGDQGVVSAAFDMNDAGTVVGRSALVATPFWLSVPNDAVMWEGGVLTSLGTLGGFLGDARHVNASKTVIGSSNTATSDFARGFVWDPVNGMREITPAEPAGFGQVEDLNDQDVICGSATLGATPFACIWPDPDQPPTFLPVFPGDVASVATAIDEAGMVVGAGTLATGETRARLWLNGVAYDLGALLPERLPFPLARALDLNEGGQILVSAEFTPAFGFVDVVLTPLPALTGSPASISVGAGGTQQLGLNAGAGAASALYLLLGSASGTKPGLAASGFVLPLNPDAYFFFTANSPNTPPLAGSFGFLDGAGKAQAAFSLPPGSPPALVGLTLHHAYGVADAVTGAILGASNAAPLALVP